MSISNERRKELFGLLDDLGARDRGDLYLVFATQDESVVEDLKTDLLDENNTLSSDTPEEFADLIYELREQKRNWSRRLGKLLIVVEQLTSRNEKQLAVKEIDDFISACTAPFYREIAANEKSRLE